MKNTQTDSFQSYFGKSFKIPLCDFVFKAPLCGYFGELFVDIVLFKIKVPFSTIFKIVRK